MSIFDIHVHVQVGQPNIDEFIPYVNACGIDGLLLIGDVLGLGYNPNEEQIRQINDHNFAVVARYPGICLGFAFLNPLHDRHFNDAEFERCLSLGARGVKLEVSTLASDPRLDPIMERLEAQDMPLLHHSWNTRVIGRESRLGCWQTDADDIASLARRFPRVTIVAAHLRGNGIRGVVELAPFENVLFDTSGGQPVAGILEYAVNSIGADRIIYGSDTYFPSGRDFPCQLAAVTAAKIKDSEKEKILFRNARRLLKIKAERD